MKLKDKLFEFRKTYQELIKKVNKTIKKTELKINNISDAQILQTIKEKKEIYLKHDLPPLKALAEKYKIDLSKLNATWKKYRTIENQISERKEDFERLNLKKITFNPKSVEGLSEEGLPIYFKISNIGKSKLTTTLHCEYENYLENYNKHATKLKKKLSKLLQSEV